MNIPPAARLGLFALALVGCDGGGVAAFGPDIQVAFVATTTDARFAAVRSSEAQTNVEEAWVSLRTIELSPCSPDAASVTMAENYPLDLAHDPPSQAVLESGVSEYCSMRVEVLPASGSAPAPLDELGVRVRGTRADGVPFDVRSVLAENFVLPSASEAEPFQSRQLVLGFDLAVWFDGIELEGASLSGGVALLARGSNEAELAAFEANTAGAVALYVDVDRDGKLDDDELTPISQAR